MKILKANAGVLTNFEVYEFLKKKGASTDPAQRLMVTKIRPIELQVFDYLVTTPASNQTRECINEFMEKAKEFDLAKADMVNIVNIRPVDAAEAAPCIEDSTRLDDDRLIELQQMVDEVLPPHPNPNRFDEKTAVDESAAQATDEESPEDRMDAS